MKIVLRIAAFLAVIASAFAGTMPGQKILVSKTNDGLALQGYDAVAYFTDNKPVKGDAKFTAEYDGANYRFASAEHRAMFMKDAAKYAPAFGGYCGYAASVGKVRPTNPEYWSIVDGALILQHSKGAVELWEKDVGGNKSKADNYWPRLIKAKAGVKNPVDGLLGRSVLADVK